MSDFDYGNARLRAMKSRLLSRRTLEGLAEIESVESLITALTNTAYREAVEAALVRLAGLECLNEALRNDLIATIGSARVFFSGRAGEQAALVLRRYDVHNVKTVLRGLARHVPASDILASTLPVGELRPVDLGQLAGAADLRIAIDLLATWRLPLARPLLVLSGVHPGADLFEMEVALDRWYLDAALREAVDEAGEVLRETLMLAADMMNILTALRLVGVPDAATILRERFASDDATPLFVGPGHMPWALLAEAARQASVSRAVDTLAETHGGETLVRAMEDYTAGSRLSVFERALAQRQLQHAARLLVRDPLGIGVLLGYVALKTNEVANLRTIAQGLLLGQQPEQIRAEWMLVE